MTIEQIKIAMIHAVGLDVRKIEHSITEEFAEGSKIYSSIGTEILLTAGMDTSQSAAHKETLKTSYDTVDITKSNEFFDALKQNSSGSFFVFDNFHYLSPSVQQQFCSFLKEFNYRGIKIIIVGVWKDASRITALAPDLVNRCEHIDIGSWSFEEFDEVVSSGSSALNIEIDEDAKLIFQKCSANNIGIFKDFLQKYCQKFEVYKTQSVKKLLSDASSMERTAKEIISEAYFPLHDRIINLAMPQREKKDSKHMRQKIVTAVLQLIIENDLAYTQTGIPLTVIKDKIDFLCKDLAEENIGISNLTQELGLLHLREENRQTGLNFIPLFYFDKANKKLLVLEPTIYEIKAYNQSLLTDIVDELIDSISRLPECKQQLAISL